MPSPKRGTDRDHSPFEFLVGVTLPKWRGVNKEASPAAPEDGQLRDGVNIRPIQDGYVSRSGQEKLTSSAVGSIEGMFEAGDRGAPHPADLPIGPPESDDGVVYFAGVNAGVEDVLLSYDTLAATLGSDVFDASGSPYYRGLRLIRGSDGKLYAGSSKVDVPGAFGAVTHTAVHRIDIPFSKVLLWEVATAVEGDFNSYGARYNLAEHPTAALKFIRGFTWADTASGGAQTGKVYYDGGLDDTYSATSSPFGERAGPEFAAFNSTLYAAWGLQIGDVTGGIRKRTGAATWAALTMPAPPTSNKFYPFGRSCAVEYGGKLWVAGHYEGGFAPHSCWYLSIDAAGNVVQEHRVIGGYKPRLLTVFDDKLIYFYEDSGGNTGMGAYNGSVWDDNAWAVAPALSHTALAVGKLGSYIYLFTGPSGTAHLLRANATDLTTWVDLGVVPGLPSGFSGATIIGIPA